MPKNRPITALGDIPVRAAFAEPVFVAMEDSKKSALPKLPNLVSRPAGPLCSENPSASITPNPINSTGTSFHRFDPVQATGWKLGGDGGGTSQNGFLINGNRVTGGGDLGFDFYP